MNRIKKIIAWLDWSTYAKTYERVDYEAPSSLCKLFFRVIGIVLFFPTTIFVHFSNTFIDFRYYKEQSNNHKYLGSWIEGMIINFVCLVATSLFVGNIEKEGYLDIMTFSDPWWFTYIKAMLLGALLIVIGLSLLAGVIWLIYKFVKFIIAIVKYDPRMSLSGSYITRVFKWIKQKTCITIDWTTIKN